MKYGWTIEWNTGRKVIDKDGKRRNERKSFESESRREIDSKEAELKAAGCRNIKVMQCIF